MLTHPRRSLGRVQLDWTPQPGHYLEFDGHTYAVLERHHRYRLRSGRYQLSEISLHVQRAEAPEERSLAGDRWVLGDATCRFNARSELVRCAVNPTGPCHGCRAYEPAGDRQ